MKIMMNLGILLISLSVSAQHLPYSLTKVESNYECKSDGATVALSLPTDVTEAKVWQIDGESGEGLQVKLSKFQKNSCLGCYTFEGKISDQVLVFGEIIQNKLVYKIQDLETGSEFVALEADCKKLSK